MSNSRARWNRLTIAGVHSGVVLTIQIISNQKKPTKPESIVFKNQEFWIFEACSSMKCFLSLFISHLTVLFRGSTTLLISTKTRGSGSSFQSDCKHEIPSAYQIKRVIGKEALYLNDLKKFAILIQKEAPFCTNILSQIFEIYEAMNLKLWTFRVRMKLVGYHGLRGNGFKQR